MKISKLLLAALCTLSFTACSDDDDNNNGNGDKAEKYAGFFVLNEGNMTNNIPGSLTNINPDRKEAIQDVFMAANGRVLGDTPNRAMIYGNKMYIAVTRSNTIEIVDKNTLKSVKTIVPVSSTGTQPRAFAAKDGKVYVSMYDGYASMIDTLSLEIEKTVKVGPNPNEIAIAGNYLYVTNSDGENWMNGYADGKTVSKINLSTFTEEKKIEVGLNPDKMVSNGKDLFVICTGDYSPANPSTLKRIKSDDSVETLFGASFMAINGDKLYVINAPYTNYGEEPIVPTYFVYSISGNQKTELALADIISPMAIGVSPKSGNIFVSTYSVAGGWSDPCFVNEYTPAGSLIKKYDAGIGATCLIF